MSTTTPNLGLTVPAMGDQISSTIPALGTNFQTLDNKFGILSKNIFNVLAYGADPTGTTDSTTAIQNAINAASGVGEVYLPAGTYLINSSLNVGSATRLRGAGKRLTVIKTTSAITAVTFNGTSTTAVYYIEIIDLQLNGNSAGTVGAQLNYARECWIRNCYISNFQQGVNAVQSWSNGIHQSEIKNNSDTNVVLGDQSNDFTLNDCQLDSGGNYGAHITQDCSAINFEGCVFQACGKDGVLLDAGRSVSFKSCYFEDNNANQISGCGDIRVSGSISVCEGIFISGTQFWARYENSHVFLDNVRGVCIVGNSFNMNSGYVTQYAVQTTAITFNVFTAGNYKELNYNDVGNAIFEVSNPVFRTDINVIKTFPNVNAQTTDNTKPGAINVKDASGHNIVMFTHDSGGNGYMSHYNSSNSTQENYIRMDGTYMLMYKGIDMNYQKLQRVAIHSGTTANRPSSPVVGMHYVDTSINKPIWHNGTNWIDATGATV